MFPEVTLYVLVRYLETCHLVQQQAIYLVLPLGAILWVGVRYSEYEFCLLVLTSFLVHFFWPQNLFSSKMLALRQK